MSNFKHLSQVVRKNKIFEYFSMYFYGLNLGCPARGHLESWDPYLRKKTLYRITSQCYIPNSKHLSQVVLKKKILNIFLCIYILYPGTFICINLVKNN